MRVACKSAGRTNDGFVSLSSLHSFILSMNMCGALSTYSVPGPALGTGDTGMIRPVTTGLWAARGNAFRQREQCAQRVVGVLPGPQQERLK